LNPPDHIRNNSTLHIRSKILNR